MVLAIAAGQVLLEPEASAECLSGGDVYICEEPITGETPGTTSDGGTFLPGEGFHVDQTHAFLTYDLGDIVDTGTLRFSVSGIGEQSLKGADSYLLLNLTDVATPVGAPSYLIEVKVWGWSDTDPGAFGKVVIGLSDVPNGTGVEVPVDFTWDASTTYTFDVSWSAAEQSVSLRCNGAELANLPTNGQGSADMAYRYAHLTPYVNDFFIPVTGSLYGMFSVAATTPTGTGGSGGAAGSAGGSGTGGSAPVADAASEAQSDGAPETGGGAGAGGAGGADGGSGATGGGPAATPSAGDESDSGCGCRLASRSGTKAALLGAVALCAIAAARRRRR